MSAVASRQTGAASRACAVKPMHAGKVWEMRGTTLAQSQSAKVCKRIGTKKALARHCRAATRHLLALSPYRLVALAPENLGLNSTWDFYAPLTQLPGMR